MASYLQRRIQNQVAHLRWSFLQNHLTALSREQFL